MKHQHIVQYVENCTSKMKVFKTLKAMNAFIDAFRKKYGRNDDNWLVCRITGVQGRIILMDPSTRVEYEQDSRGKVR